MADDFEKYQPTKADIALDIALASNVSSQRFQDRANVKSYVITDHRHTILLEISREVAVALLENVSGLEGVVVNEGSILRPRMVLINKFAVEIAPNLWVYNHDGNYRLTAPIDKVDEGGRTYAKRLRFE